MSRNLKDDDCSCAGNEGEVDKMNPTWNGSPALVALPSINDTSKPIMKASNKHNDFASSHDIASVARLPEETLVGITIDDAFIQQQEAIMREFGNNNVERMGKARRPPPRGIFKNIPTGKIPPPVTSPHSQDEVVASNMNEYQDTTNICDYLNDADLIREQLRIYQEIQLQHEAKPSNITMDDLYTTQTPTQDQVDSLKDQVSETSTTAINQAREMPNNSSKTVLSDKVIASSQDHVTRLGNGKNLRVKGTKHAYMSISRGTAIIVTCPCCQTVLQVDASTKLLYCTRCEHVSPIELATSPKNHGDKGGLYDYQIAGSVQQQEIEVACARKMSKMQH
jgi:hypothetical protein